jgi:nucleoside-diphosphate-sugar epimerase
MRVLITGGAGFIDSGLALDFVEQGHEVTVLDCLSPQVHGALPDVEPMRAGLELFYPRMAGGGLLLVHDYANPHWEGPRRAVDEFCLAAGEQPILMADLAGSVFIRRTQ